MFLLAWSLAGLNYNCLMPLQPLKLVKVNLAKAMTEQNSKEYFIEHCLIKIGK